MYEDEDNDGNSLMRARSRSATPARSRKRRATASSGRGCLERLENSAAGRMVCARRGPRPGGPARRPTGTAARPVVISTIRAGAPRGAVCLDGGERPSSLRRRSGGVKLEAAQGQARMCPV